MTEVVCAPGNGGMAQTARCVPVDLKDLDAMVRLAEAERPALTVVGPELPLSLGIVDALRERGLRVFGPTRAAAMLESSKGFAKQFLQRHNIPTPNFAVCSSHGGSREGHRHVSSAHRGQGRRSVRRQGRDHLSLAPTPPPKPRRAFSLAHCSARPRSQIVIEEFLEGDEVSFLCLSDGKHVTPLVPAQDHKRIGEGDTGPNTGGMGVYSTDTLLDPAMSEWILRHIAEPTVAGMAAEGTPFTGVLYCGLMMTARGPQVLEFNARFGDPETQAILVRLESDLVDALEACVDGRLAETPLGWSRGASACVVASSGGYPGQLQNRPAHQRPRRRGPGSRRAGLPRGHGAQERANAYGRRPRSGRYRRRGFARRGAGSRLPGHGRDSL